MCHYQDRYQTRQQVRDDIEADRGDGVDEDEETTMTDQLPALYERME